MGVLNFAVLAGAGVPLLFLSGAKAAPVILNEYNAVSSTNWLGASTAAGATYEDTCFGRAQGNGGNWFELVVVTDHFDLHGARLQWEEVGSGKAGAIFLSSNIFWTDLRAGTIITFTESNAAQGGLNTDLSFDPCNGDWWININTFDVSYVTTTTTNVVGDGPGNFSVGSSGWRLTIFNNLNAVIFGPAGEGAIGYPGANVDSMQICRLQANPAASISATSPYDDGKDSSFGSPNNWKDAVTLCRLYQNFDALCAPVLSSCHICQRIILNEYNAVADNLFLNGGTQLADVDGLQAADTFFGRVLGNGGNWFELVATKDHLDMRGWRLVWEEVGPGSGPVLATGTIALANHPFWSNIRAGEVLSFIEKTTTQGGLDTNLSYNPSLGDRWVNINTFDTALVAGTTSTNIGHVSGQFSVSDNNWRLTIRDGANNLVSGPWGEGSAYFYRDKVGNTNICRFEDHPTSSTVPLGAFSDGVHTSTFGSLNQWSLCPSGATVIESLAALPDPTCGKAADVTVNGVVNIDDLLAIINGWGQCAPASGCLADINSDGTVNIDDLLAVINNWG